MSVPGEKRKGDVAGSKPKEQEREDLVVSFQVTYRYGRGGEPRLRIGPRLLTMALAMFWNVSCLS